MFAFHLQHQHHYDEDSNNDSNSNSDSIGGGRGGDFCVGGDGAGGAGSGSVLVPRSDGAAGKTELGVVLMKFEHTREPIDAVSCSREQVCMALFCLVALERIAAG